MGKMKNFMIEAHNNLELAEQLLAEACERHTAEYKKTKNPDYMREKEQDCEF